MALRVVRLGTPRRPGEGLRIGVVRRPPRGVWLPELSPSEKWVKWALSEPWTDARWKKYARNYQREMGAPSAQRLMELVAALSRRTALSIGCYCEREERCHR